MREFFMYMFAIRFTFAGWAAQGELCAALAAFTEGFRWLLPREAATGTWTQTTYMAKVGNYLGFMFVISFQLKKNADPVPDPDFQRMLYFSSI
jgi:hypothetical protein